MRKMLMAAMFAVLATGPALGAWDPDRIVTAVDDVAKTFSCQAEAGERISTYKTTNNTVYRTVGKRVRLSYIWNKGRFSEMKVGEIVSVRYHLRGDELIAERVAIRPKQ